MKIALKLRVTLAFTLIIGIQASAIAEERVLRLYHDADWGNHVESAESIWRGVTVALAESDFRVQGYRLEVVRKNHGGNVIRSLANNKDFLKDDTALAIISGIHSAPLIKNREFINQNDILTLVPWAAGAPITRYPDAKNWIFRLSVDDTKAGEILTEFALSNKGCKSPYLLLEDTPWGDSNLVNINKAMKSRGVHNVGLSRFNWGIKGHSARGLTMSISANGADCILLVANAVEGLQFADAVLSMNPDKRIPIISHWGITAGNFHETFGAEKRRGVDLTFIQTCFSFLHPNLSERGEAVLARARTQFPNAIKAARDIRSPVGFIHGYDLTRLLLQALNSIELTDNISANRNNVRVALEQLTEPNEGLVKTYEAPFSVFDGENPDAHEALGSDDICMARYNGQDDIILEL